MAAVFGAFYLAVGPTFVVAVRAKRWEMVRVLVLPGGRLHHQPAGGDDHPLGQVLGGDGAVRPVAGQLPAPAADLRGRLRLAPAAGGAAHPRQPAADRSSAGCCGSSAASSPPKPPSPSCRPAYLAGRVPLDADAAHRPGPVRVPPGRGHHPPVDRPGERPRPGAGGHAHAGAPAAGGGPADGPLLGPGRHLQLPASGRPSPTSPSCAPAASTWPGARGGRPSAEGARRGHAGGRLSRRPGRAGPPALGAARAPAGVVPRPGGGHGPHLGGLAAARAGHRPDHQRRRPGRLRRRLGVDRAARRAGWSSRDGTGPGS